MDFLEIIKVIFLGIIEGITEWLPISSTGHMIIFDSFVKLNITEEFKELFFVVIQLGAILAVVYKFFTKLNPFSPKKNKEEKKDTWNLIFKVIVACIPAGIIGLLFDDKIDSLFYNYQTVAITLILYGILFIVIEKYFKKKDKITTLKELSYSTVLLIGMAQVLALIPGTSRSGATIIAAMLLGTSRIVATEFTFFLAIPVMLGASLLKIVKFLAKGFMFTNIQIIYLILGMVVAYIVSVLVINFLMSYIKKKDFKVFGYYRIVLGIIVLILGLINII